MKTELIIFWPSRLAIDYSFKLKQKGKKIFAIYVCEIPENPPRRIPALDTVIIQD